MQHTVEVSCPVAKSFRVDQVRGMFDLTAAKTANSRFDVELPDETEDWKVGVIVGPSGSGKTTVARKAYGERFVTGFEWPQASAVVDAFDQAMSVKDVTAMLSAVGFSSPPSWVKPYHVLSGGERFRCDLARALLGGGDLVAFDEFTSVVDRTVAQIGSAAVAKAIRKGNIKKRFVAVTCHYDILDWLEPDWVLDMATQQLARGSLQRPLYRRPTIELEVAPVRHSAWLLFRRHHYLNTEISIGAKCFVAFWHGEPVAFSAWTHAMTCGRRGGDMREHRTVVLPDFQGVGIGNRLSGFCASIYRGLGRQAFSTTSHPAMVRYRSGSPLWHRKRLSRAAPLGSSGIFSREAAKRGKKATNSYGRITGGFEYVGPPMSRADAERFADRDIRTWVALDSMQAVIDVLAHQGATVCGLAARTGLSRTRVQSLLDELESAELAKRCPLGRARYFWALTPAGEQRFAAPAVDPA